MKLQFRKTELTSVNYPGMFDLMKGWGMILIIIGHIENLFDGGILHFSGFSWAAVPNAVISFLTFDNVTILLFLIISGYGFRPAPFGSTAKKQAKQLLKPYAIVSVLTCTFHLIAHYTAFHYLRASVKQTILVAAGYCLGASTTFYYKDNAICSIGAVWFLLTLFLSWLLLDLIMLKLPEKMHPVAVILCAALGWGLSLLCDLPYCIEQALIGTAFLYLGYCAKKDNWFARKFPVWVYLLLAASWFISVPAVPFDLATAKFPLGLPGILLVGAAAVLTIMILLKLNQFEFPLRSQICTIGRYSLWIMCLSTVCSQAFPWYLAAIKAGEHKYIGFLFVLVGQAIFIRIGFMIVKSISDRRARKLREEKKRKRAEKKALQESASREGRS